MSILTQLPVAPPGHVLPGACSRMGTVTAPARPCPTHSQCPSLAFPLSARGPGCFPSEHGMCLPGLSSALVLTQGQPLPHPLLLGFLSPAALAVASLVSWDLP